MDKYETQLRYAAQADDKAAMYLRWATAARNHNVPISVINQGMGHTSEQTTQIYLTMLENSVIDDANKGIISGLL